jgi:hypothetical protein
MRDVLEKVWGVVSFLLIIGFIVFRVITITHLAKSVYCANKNATEVVNYFAVPFVQPAVYCTDN